jgi:hypothetical protein
MNGDAIKPPPSGDSLENAKFEFEKWRAEEEFKLRREELAIKRQESSKSMWTSPLFLGILGLIATIIGSIIQNAWQASANRTLEERKFESTLIQKALETDDQVVASQRLKRLLDLNLIQDNDKITKIQGWVNNPLTIPVVPPEETYEGEDRKKAKLSIGSASIETYSDLGSLIGSLPSIDAMLSHSPAITTAADSGRVAEEQRNVHVHAFLYAASREADHDFHLIIGDSQNATVFLSAEISGLPAAGDSSFGRLKNARDTFEQFFNNKLPQAGYDFYYPPIPIEVEGSLFFDATHAKGQRPGPQSLKSRMPTIWEIHPVTSIEIDKHK